MKQEYTFKNKGLWKGLTADKAVQELERIRAKHGTLKPEMVVEESRDKDAVLHGIFQWDDTIAAEMWRREQASTLIRNIVVVMKEDSIECRVRALVNVSTVNEEKRSYIPIVEAIHDDVAYNDMLEQAKNEMSSFVTKYAQIEELNNVKAEMLKVITQNNKL